MQEPDTGGRDWVHLGGYLLQNQCFINVHQHLNGPVHVIIVSLGIQYGKSSIEQVYTSNIFSTN